MKKWIKPSVMVIVLDEEDIVTASNQVRIQTDGGQKGADPVYDDTEGWGDIETW